MRSDSAEYVNRRRFGTYCNAATNSRFVYCAYPDGRRMRRSSRFGATCSKGATSDNASRWIVFSCPSFLTLARADFSTLPAGIPSGRLKKDRDHGDRSPVDSATRMRSACNDGAWDSTLPRRAYGDERVGGRAAKVFQAAKKS